MPKKGKKMNDEVLVQLDELARRDLAANEAMAEGNLLADEIEGTIEVLGYTQIDEDIVDPETDDLLTDPL